ncbi:DUF262 domain-containing protein [Pontivivens ytuae]|uniref:DUF262 domain-containing protein n=1 Tax=Pontivivens ytuae TaxID=2789856 RepID=A0A7S9QF03_9RHOB|nr:DUF262 domain-containing HNH endonuclease family protein [Pontivivens ytuae]QPH56002.1 DUF262 domain-containing protein [Pontivivens ytuae]
MTIDVKDSFRANPRSVREFLLEPGQGCYIPAYQREYRWDKGNVDRLFEDVVMGLCQLPDRAKTISFLGTVIAIHDTTYATVKPVHRNEMPRSVMTIIDGQQRLSTFILIFIALHDQLCRHRRTFDRIEGEAETWLKTEIDKLSPELQDCVILDRRTGSGLNRYYPRIIRSFVDVWSSQPDTAKYDGAIASMIWQYISHVLGEEQSQREFRPSNLGDDDGPSANVLRVYSHIVNRLKRLGRQSEDQPELLDYAVKPGFGMQLLGYEIDESVVSRLQSLEDNPADRRFRDAFCGLIFGHYAQQRMAFTVVQTGSEDDAFDMFEALNTTGEPLTAFETFEPRVIEAEGLEAYEASEAHRQMKRVKTYLDQFIEQTDKVQKATSSMLVSFALADTGEKLGAKLNEQRRYLRKRFDDPDGGEGFRAAFIERLGDVADFMAVAWTADGLAGFGDLSVSDAQSIVSLEYLRNLNHTVTVAPLSRFFGHALAANEPEARRRAVADLSKAMKACASFSALWRGAFGGTANIDAVYRKVMAEGDGTSALSADPKGRVGTVDIRLLKSLLRSALEDKEIDTVERWTARAERCPIYTGSKPTAQFLLIAAAHDAEADRDASGLTVRGRVGVHPTLEPVAWSDLSAKEIEHVAPQSGVGSTWDQRIYEDRDILHSLGNLTLLPKLQNIVMSDHPWPMKRAGLKALAARTPEDFEALRQEARELGLELPAQGEAILASATYSPFNVPISSLQGDWDLDFLLSRSSRLAMRAWETLRPWLDD